MTTYLTLSGKLIDETKEIANDRAVKAQRFDDAKAELFSITEGRTVESYEDGDSAVRFIFALETQGQAEALKLELAHFPDQYESILALFNPIT